MNNAQKIDDTEPLPMLSADDQWLTFTRACERRGHSKMTGWRHRKAGTFPPPDGRNVHGHDMWLQSTIDNDYRKNLED